MFQEALWGIDASAAGVLGCRQASVDEWPLVSHGFWWCMAARCGSGWLSPGPDGAAALRMAQR